MSNQLQITGGAKVRNLEGVLTGTSGVVNALAINVPNGIPQLDGSGKILVSQLPNSVMEYKGTWDASTNTPTLADGTGNQGDVYLCNVAGTVNFGAGPITFFVGDQVIYSGTIWQRASGASGTVTSVAVTESGDSLNITGSPITTSGTINIGFNGTNLQYINGAGDLTTFPSLTGYVPYSGATGNVNLGEFGLTGGYLGFDTTPTSTPTAQGTMYWNADKESVDVIMNGVTGSVMQDNFYNVKNQTGSTITKGTVVRANGTVGASGRILIAPFLADGSYDSKICLGVTAETILNGEDGKVTAFGAIRQIDTSAFANGTILYASPSTAGGFTSTEPTNPNNIVTLAIVVYSDVNNGEIFVRPTFVDNAADIASSLGYTPANSALVVPYTGATANVDLGLNSLFAYDLYANGNGTNNANLYLKQGTLSLLIQNGYSNILATGTKIGFQVATSAIAAYYADLQFSSLTAQRTYTLPDASGTIALTSSLSSYVPYTGATANVNLGTFDLSAYAVSADILEARLNGTASSPLILRTGTSGFAAGLNAISLISSPSIANTLSIISDVSSVTKTAQIGLGSLSATRTYTLPDASGTLALLESSQTFTGINTFSSASRNESGILLKNGFTTYSNSYTSLGGNIGNLIISGSISGTPFDNELAFTPSTSNTYTFPNATGTIALTSDLTGYVPLAGNVNVTGPLGINTTGGAGTTGLTNFGTFITRSDSTQGFPRKLAISMASGTLVSIDASGNGANYITDMAFSTSTASGLNGTPAIYITGTNNRVGIKTGTPAYDLDVSGTLRNTTSAYFATTSGSVGIGTTSPSKLLHLYNTAGTDVMLVESTQVFSTIAFKSSTNSSTVTIGIDGAGNAAIENKLTTGAMAFVTNGSERMRITSGGYVGINANGTNAQLDIKSSTNSFPIIYGYNTSSAPYGMRIIYSTTPNNTDNWFIYADDSTAQRFSVRSNGGVYNFTANNSNLSDERLKKDIISLESVWDKIKGIEIVKYKYKDQSHDDYNMGVIAQQVETIAPELVNPDGWGTLAEDGTPYKSIYESDLNYYTIKVLQEAMAKIESLQEQINILAK